MNPRPTQSKPETIQTLPGFKDFYPEECTVRTYIFDTWRKTAQLYGFCEYDCPILEPLELYTKKNEGNTEILTQLYSFPDKKNREMALRPEMTPSLARMVAAQERNYKKPIKWFSIAPFFRYERPQKGRLRQFSQFNVDLIGDPSPAADAEIIALAIDTLRAFGLNQTNIVIKLSSRTPWLRWLSEITSAPEQALEVIDKMERGNPTEIEDQLQTYGLSTKAVKEFIEKGSPDDFKEILQNLEARNLQDYVKVDLGIVRGLTYYTGVIFEIFDNNGENRAIAGGGRYDNLLAELSEGKCTLPAVGFAIGDTVLTNLLNQNQNTKEKIPQKPKPAIYILIEDESKRSQALALIQTLRDQGIYVQYPLSPTSVSKQRKIIEDLKPDTVLKIEEIDPKTNQISLK